MDSLESIAQQVEHIGKKLDAIEVALRGSNGKLGLIGKVMVLWHGHVWVVGLVGTIVGGAIVGFLK